jgi:hypothetical protein
MSVTSNFLLLAAVVGVGAIGFVVLKEKLAAQGSGAESSKDRFKAKPLLTPNELEFLGRLEAAVPELRICPQVAMGSILDPDVPRSDGKAYMRLRGMFAQKFVDFVAQDRKTGAVVAIIELDDRTHKADKDAKRDAMLASAGYKTVRWQSKAKPDAAAIRAELMPASQTVQHR